MTGRFGVVRSAALAIVTSVGTVLPAHAFDLTGRWVGRESCRVYDGVLSKESVEFGPSNPVRITQTGNSVAVVMGSATDGVAYYGDVVSHPSKPKIGRALLTECRSDTALSGYTEVIHFEGTASAAAARLRGESIVRTLFGEIGMCKWQLIRTSLDDPSVTCSCCP